MTLGLHPPQPGTRGQRKLITAGRTQCAGPPSRQHSLSTRTLHTQTGRCPSEESFAPKSTSGAGAGNHGAFSREKCTPVFSSFPGTVGSCQLNPNEGHAALSHRTPPRALAPSVGQLAPAHILLAPRARYVKQFRSITPRRRAGCHLTASLLPRRLSSTNSLAHRSARPEPATWR